MGFIFQSYNLIPVLTARENTEFVLLLQARAPRSGARTAEVLAAVGLKGMEDRRPSELSGATTAVAGASDRHQRASF